MLAVNSEMALVYGPEITDRPTVAVGVFVSFLDAAPASQLLRGLKMAQEPSGAI